LSFDPPVFVPMLFFFFTTEYYRGRMEKIQAAGRFLRVILVVLVVATRIISVLPRNRRTARKGIFLDKLARKGRRGYIHICVNE
jgi:hypothetical protein